MASADTKPASFQDASNVKKVMKASANFAVNLYKKLASETDSTGNLFFSPASVSSALAMTWLGARSNTAAQVKSALGFEGIDDELVHTAFQDYGRVLAECDAGYKLLCANKLYCRQDYTILEEFLTHTRKYYDAEAERADFVNDGDGCVQRINQWVAETTNNKIQDLLPNGSINPLTALILVNAIYFKGDWQDKFEKMGTHKSSFQVDANKCLDNVQTMFRAADFRHAHLEDLKCRALELPYFGGDVSFVVMVPDETFGLEEMESKLTGDHLTSLGQKLTKTKIEFYLPRFKLDFFCGLNAALQSLGINDIFLDGQSDLSGINGGRDLFLSKALHKSFIEVNEEGSEAAAATALTIQAMCLEDINELRCNHPFLFFIRDTRSDTVLFMGRYKSPPGEE